MRKFVLLMILSIAGAMPLWADKEARTIKYGLKDVIELNCQVRYSVTIILPEGEKILDFTTGDKEEWIINGAQNFCYVHPTKAGTSTNLNLICASGNVYSFILTEISNRTAEIDYKVFVTLKEDAAQGALAAKPRFVAYEQYAMALDHAGQLREQLITTEQQANEKGQKEIRSYKSRYPAKLRFDYQFKSIPPFNVSAIYHDEDFTYIYSDAPEKPALYEIKDGKPNLTNFQFEQGVYIVPKIIDSGYLQIGKKKLSFHLAASK
jgi:type IV secretory pathway VirB9-like protein